MLKRLDVNVGRAAFHGVGEQAVDQLHHRRVVGEVLGLDVFVRLVLDHLQVFLLLHALEQALQLCVGLLVIAVDGVAQRVLPGDDREDVAAGDELDILDRRDVVGVGYGDRQRPALPLEGKDGVLGGDVWGEELQDFRVDLEARQIDRRHPVLPGQHLADLGLLDKTQFYQGVTQAHPGVFLFQERLFQLLLGDQPLADEDLTELVLGKGNARRTQLVEIEGTNMCFGAKPVKVGAQKDGSRPIIWHLHRVHCRGDAGCQKDRVRYARRRSAAPGRGRREGAG